MRKMLRAAGLFALFLLPATLSWSEPSSSDRAGEFRIPASNDPTASYRFLPDGDWLPLDRPLVLGASPGEERSYSLELRDSKGSSLREYLVDRLSPPPPLASIAGGTYGGPLAPSLSGEAGASIFWALSGPGKDFAGFAPWDPTHPLRLPAAEDMSQTWVLVAYAVDASGNQSTPARYSWTILPPGLDAAGAVADNSPPAVHSDPNFDPGAPTVVEGDSEVSLRFALPKSGTLVAAINPGDDLSRLERWQPIPVVGTAAILHLGGPHGWRAKLPVFVGLLDKGILRFDPTPVSTRIEPQVLDAAASAPPSPSIIAGASGSATLVLFPHYDGDILISIGDGAETSYREPFMIGPGSGSVLIRWRGRGLDGKYTATNSVSVPRPLAFSAVPLLGLEGPKVRNSAFVLSPAQGVSLRYELVEGDAIPKPVTALSSLLSGPLSIDAAEGKSRSVTIRYRIFSGSGADAVGGDEGIAHLVVDRIPPPPPVLSSVIPSFSRQTQKVALSSGGDGKIFFKLDGGTEGSTTGEYSTPIELAAPSEGWRVWRLSAWTVDAAGNSSTRIGPYECMIDPVGLYVDQGAPAGGDGNPGHPFASLESAFAAAGGKGAVIHLRSGYRLSAPIRLASAAFEISGGSRLRWLWPDSPDRTTLALPAPSKGAPAIIMDGGQLTLDGLSLSCDAGEGEALTLRNGAILHMADSGFEGKTASTLSLIASYSSTLDLSGAVLALGGSGGGSDILALDSSLTIADSDLGSRGSNSWLTVLSMKGGSLVLRTSRLSAAAGIGAVGISLDSTRLSIDRISLELGDSAGYRRAGVFAASAGEMVNSHIVSTGTGTTLVESKDSPLLFAHDSFIDFARGSLVLSVRGAAPRLIDDLFLSKGGGRLLEVDRPLGGDPIAACAFAGFSSLVSGASTIRGVADLLIEFRSSIPSLDLGDLWPLRSAPKGGFEVIPGSPIVDAGTDSGVPAAQYDFSGFPRPQATRQGSPDIGADELQ